MIKLVFLVGFGILFVGMAIYHSSPAKVMSNKSVHDYSAVNIDGREINLKQYEGDILLIVNTASQCGYTPQYEGLQAIYEKYQGKGFEILGFPANNFGGQEPGSEKEIKEFCTLKYKVTFPMFAKISVKGEDIHPLYDFLTDKEQNPDFGGDITWNFNKFLVNEKGEIVARFSSKDTPASETVINAIEKLLLEKAKTETIKPKDAAN